MKIFDLNSADKFMEHGASKISPLEEVDVTGVNLVYAKQQPHTTVSDMARTAHICLILSGEVKVQSGEIELIATAGTLLGFEADEKRIMINETDSEVGILLINPGARPQHKGGPKPEGRPENH